VVGSDDDRWLEMVRRRLPVGTVVRGVVRDRQVFGSFVRIEGHDDLLGIVEINNYRPRGEAVAPDQLPTPGSQISAVVVDHHLQNRQVRLRVESDL
jgi:ribosomal protein S1